MSKGTDRLCVRRIGRPGEHDTACDRSVPAAPGDDDDPRDPTTRWRGTVSQRAGAVPEKDDEEKV